MILYLAIHRGVYKQEALFDLFRFLRAYRSAEEAACDLWKPGENLSGGYEIFAIDFENLKIQKVRFPEVRFRSASGKALTPKITAVQHFQNKMFVGLKTPKVLKGIRTRQKGTVDEAKETLESLKRTLKDTRKLTKMMRKYVKDKSVPETKRGEGS